MNFEDSRLSWAAEEVGDINVLRYNLLAARSADMSAAKLMDSDENSNLRSIY